jgi:hypothetical protein
MLIINMKIGIQNLLGRYLSRTNKVERAILHTKREIIWLVPLNVIKKHRPMPNNEGT